MKWHQQPKPANYARRTRTAFLICKRIGMEWRVLERATWVEEYDSEEGDGEWKAVRWVDVGGEVCDG